MDTAGPEKGSRKSFLNTMEFLLATERGPIDEKIVSIWKLVANGEDKISRAQLVTLLQVFALLI